jgi:hypothetical protein
MVVARRTTKIGPLKRSGTKDDVAQRFAKEISRQGIDNGRSRMGLRVQIDDKPFDDYCNDKGNRHPLCTRHGTVGFFTEFQEEGVKS